MQSSLSSCSSLSEPPEPTSAAVYPSKLRAKREERLQQRRLQEQQQSEASEDTSNLPGELVRSFGLTEDSSFNASSYENLVANKRETQEETKKRIRAEARHVLIKYKGSVWDAVKHNEVEILRRFFLVEGADRLLKLHNKEDMNEGGRTLLHTAAWHGHLESLVFLLVQGASVDAIDTTASRTSPLMEAARAGHASICVKLLQQGADPTQRDAHGDTAFHCAARRGHGTVLLQMALALDSTLLSTSIWLQKNQKGKTVVDYVRQHPMITPLLEKRLGRGFSIDSLLDKRKKSRFQLKAAMVSTQTCVHHPDDHGPCSSPPTTPLRTTRPSIASAASYDTAPDAVGNTTLRGVDALGLDLSSFTYAVR